MAVFIDTGAFMAYRNTLDTHHEKADDLFREALKGEFGNVVTTDFIYDEALTLAMVRTGNKDIVSDISDVILSPRIEMIFIDKSILTVANELFFKYFQRGISFTDSTTMAVMKKLGIENIISFDEHFQGMFNVL